VDELYDTDAAHRRQYTQEGEKSQGRPQRKKMLPNRMIFRIFTVIYDGARWITVAPFSCLLA
jgi:hypothetical protein